MVVSAPPAQHSDNSAAPVAASAPNRQDWRAASRSEELPHAPRLIGCVECSTSASLTEAPRGKLMATLALHWRPEAYMSWLPLSLHEWYMRPSQAPQKHLPVAPAALFCHPCTALKDALGFCSACPASVTVQHLFSQALLCRRLEQNPSPCPLRLRWCRQGPACNY
jgi:hypothetical protein